MRNPFRRGYTNGRFLYCISVLLYVIHDSLLKFLSTYSLTEGTIFYRAFISLSILIAISLTKKINVLYIHSFKNMFLRCFFSLVTLWFSIKALAGISLQVYNIYYHLSPLFAVFFAIIFLKEQVNKKIFIALFLGFIGGIISFNTEIGGSITCRIYALLASASWALSITTLKKLTENVKPITILFYSSLFNVLITTPILEENQLSYNELCVIILLSIIHLAAFYLMIISLQQLPLYQAAPLEYTGLIWAFIIGYLIWNEKVDYNIIIGSALIIISSSYSFRLRNKVT